MADLLTYGGETRKYYSFSPSQRYLAEKLKPESISEADLKALAAAEARAAATGVMHPDLERYFLANALVENRPGDYGVNDAVAPVDKVVDFAPLQDAHSTHPAMSRKQYESSSPLADIADKMGLKGYATTETNPDFFKPPMASRPYSTTRSVNFDSRGMAGVPAQENRMADVAAAMLASKAVGRSADEAVERWNGAGPGAKNHLAKVKEAHTLLTHPSNREMWTAYQGFLKDARKAVDAELKAAKVQALEEKKALAKQAAADMRGAK